MSINYQNIIQNLWENPTIREDFLAQPKTFLENQGQEIPKDMKVSAHAETPSQRYFILPPNGTDIPESDIAETKIIRRALEDSVYKALLFKNPQAAAQEIGVSIPDSITFTVLQNSENELHLVLPVNPSDSELSDADLEAIAGGKSDKKKAAICGGTAGAATIGCAAAAFTLVTVAASVGAGAAGIASATA